MWMRAIFMKRTDVDFLALVTCRERPADYKIITFTRRKSL